MRVYLDERELYVHVDHRDHGSTSGGPLLLVRPDGSRDEQFRLPEPAVELRPQSDVVTELSNALSERLVDMKVSAAVSRAIGEVLAEHGDPDVAWWMS